MTLPGDAFFAVDFAVVVFLVAMVAPRLVGFLVATEAATFVREAVLLTFFTGPLLLAGFAAAAFFALTFAGPVFLADLEGPFFTNFFLAGSAFAFGRALAVVLAPPFFAPFTAFFFAAFVADRFGAEDFFTVFFFFAMLNCAIV